VKTNLIELAPVPSLIGLAHRRQAVDASVVRPLRADDVPAVAELIDRAGRALDIGRLATTEELSTWLEAAPPKRALVLLRDGLPIGVVVYARRQLLGNEVTEVANVDLLVAPDSTPEEGSRLGGALAADAAASGAKYVVAPKRPESVFPHVLAAGLRLAMRTLRVFIVPSVPGDTVAEGASHLLEVE
jgi:hypothetical protein